METLIYLAKSAALLSIFILMYKLFLSKESFLQTNRFFLLAGLVLSFGLPLLNITQIELIEVEIPMQESFSNTISYSNEHSIPINYVDEIPEVIEASFWEQITWQDAFLFVYILGIIFFTGKLIYHSAVLLKLLQKAKKVKKNGICYMETEQEIEAFSFFNIMAYNPNLHSETELKIIKTHEAIHIKDAHSIDMLLGNLACIILWFNPLSYIYRSAIDENLEYIADAKTAQKTKSIKQYQYTLLNYFALESNMQYASYFFKQSSLKNRIMMLNKEKSSKQKLIKYSFIVPFILGFIWLFQTETIAKEVIIDVNAKKDIVEASSSKFNTSNNKNNAKLLNENNSENFQQDTLKTSSHLDNIKAKITKTTTQDGLDQLEKFFAKQQQKLKFSRVKRNKNGEITRIKIKFSDDANGLEKELVVSGTEPIKNYEVIRNFKNDTAEIVEFKEPEKELYDFLNEATQLIINGNLYTKNKPIALTDIVIKEVKTSTVLFNGKKNEELNLSIEATELEETEVSEIYKLFENDDKEREIFIFKTIEGLRENDVSLMRLEMNIPKEKFAAQFESGYDKTPKKIVHTSVYVEVVPDLQEKLKNHIQNGKQIKLNGKNFNAKQHKGQFILMENFSFNDDVLEVTGEVKNYGFGDHKLFNSYENKLSTVLNIDEDGKIAVKNMYKNNETKSFVLDVSYAENRKQLTNLYEKAEFVYINDKKVAKADLMNKVLTYQNFNIKNNELYFTDAKLRPKETNKGIARILIQLLKDNEKPNEEQKVIWFKSENELEMASMSGVITSSNQELNFKAKSEISYSNEETYSENDIQTYFNKANQVFLDGNEIQKSDLHTNVLVFGEIVLKNNQLFFKDTDFYEDIEADNFNKVIARTILYKKMLRNRSIIWFENENKLRYKKGNTAFYASPKVEDTFILNNDVAVDEINFIDTVDAKEQPIYVVNNKVVNDSIFRNIKPNEIKSVSVFKNFNTLSKELQSNKAIDAKNFNGLVKVDLKDEAYYNTHFKISITKNKDAYSMQCTEGCAWEELTFNLNRFTSQYINAFGVSGILPDKNETSDRLANFQFKMKEKSNQVQLTKLNGSHWEELSFSMQEGETYELTQNGILKQN